MKYFLLIVIIVPFLSVQAETICAKYLRELSAADAGFAQCASNFAVPVTFCEQCKIKYDELTKSYATLKAAKDDANNVTCKDIYFDKDRLNVVEKIYHELSRIWEKAYCQECYNDRNQTDDIQTKLTDFQTCLHNNKKHACDVCRDAYIEINKLYDALAKRNEGKICFDIQDKMNRSRVIWSNDLKCCKRESHLIAFTAVSSSLMILPILFYGSLVIVTRRSERNHETLDNNNAEQETDTNERNDRNQPPSETRHRNRTPSPNTTSTNNLPPTSSTGTTSSSSLKNKVQNSISADSSDDEVLETSDRNAKNRVL